MDINSYAFGFMMGKKRGGGSGGGGGSAVLGELTVTENGVYDKPVIGGELDFSVGKTLKFKDNITVDDLPDDFRWTGTSMPKATEFVYADSVTMTTVNIADYVAVMYEIWDTSGINCTKYVYTSHEELRQAMADEVGIELPTTGWCAVYVEDFDPVSAESCEPPAVVIADDVISFGVSMAPSLFRVTSTPAAGWNKVTVNVAGDIIDVPELPTENIEEGKVYRVANGDSVTYGIPNNATVQRYVDGAWVELT